ncbi:MAG: glycosyltransferase family 1 protein [Microscillaceae bacterium]|nr:glycosyltransferase family 1 protein [Microscillaceae bacterium]
MQVGDALAQAHLFAQPGSALYFVWQVRQLAQSKPRVDIFTRPTTVRGACMPCKIIT